MIIYNDYKENDFYVNVDKIKGKKIIINNVKATAKLVDFMDKNCDKWWYCVKLYKGEENLAKEVELIHDLAIKNIAVDAENYTVEGQSYMEYSSKFGDNVRKLLTLDGKAKELILLPENLGGDRYKNYDKFAYALKPKAILMERTYQQPEPWNMFYYYWLNKIRYFFLFPIIYLGVWPEETTGGWADKQMETAKWIAGDKIFWYSETKNMPS